MPSLRALILDLGEVLVRPQPPALVERMAAVAGAPLQAFTDAYWAHRKDYDLHGDGPRFWDAVLRTLGRPTGPGHEATWASLADLDARSWTDYREEVWALAKGFRDAGGRTAMLSNGVTAVMDRVRAEKDLGRYFDAVVVSCEVGCSKPDAAIYRLTMERLGVAPGEALFVDDRTENVEAARAEGLQALHYTGAGALAALRARVAA